jgi:hypothetical protein
MTMTFLDEMEASRPKRDVKWNPKIFELNFKVTVELSKSILFEKFNMGIIKRKMLISNPLTKNLDVVTQKMLGAKHFCTQ